MASLTVENYVKAIYLVCAEAETPTASTGELARRLNVSPGSVTSMLRTLSEQGLVHYQAYEGVVLTDAGVQLALRMVRRHRLLELFLVQTLGLTWDRVHEEAEHLEHAVSDWLIDRIDDYLGAPQHDPHGDPIPRSDGSLTEQPGTALNQWPTQTPFILLRVRDQSPDFLRFLSQSGFELGCTAQILQNHPYSGAMILETADHKQISLGLDAAEKLIVRPVQETQNLETRS